jgi:tetratricopeptide (TPR) repeat protein
MIGVARLIKDNPQDAEALTKIAQGLGLLGDTIQALKYAEVALQKAPTSVDASGLVARLDRDLVKLSSLANKVKVSPDDEEARRELAGITSRVKNRGTLAPVALQLVENADALLQQVPTPVAASAAAGSETNIIAAEGLTRAAKDSPDDPAVVRQLDSALVAVQRDTLATPGQMQRAVSVLKAAGKESAAEKLTSQLISKFPKSPEAKAARRSHR